MDNSLIIDGVNIAELSDEELAERLRNVGFNPGPILATTRSVYQRKLARILSHVDINEDGEVSDVDEEIRPSPILNSTLLDFSPSSSSFSVDDLRRRPLPRFEGKVFYDNPPILTPHKPWNANDILTQVEPPPGEMEKPLISTTTKIAILIILVIFVFFVYHNMESTPQDPFTAASDSTL